MELYKNKYFTVVFCSWCQEFPGQCIVSSKKECLSDLTCEEWQELGKIEKELERVTKSIFNATMFNFAALMNNAYKDKEKAHVHFHFIPRYDGKREILGKTYIDKHFGYNMWKWANNPFKRQKDIFNENERKELYELMKKEWSL